MPTPACKVVAYKGMVFCWPQKVIAQAEDNTFGYLAAAQGNRMVFTKRGTLGCVVLDTAHDLAISQEALDLLKGVRKNRDAIGDISWWDVQGGTSSFSWFGALFRVLDPKEIEASREWNLEAQILNKRFTLISNETHPDMDQYFNDENMKKYRVWRTPLSLDVDKPWEQK